MHIVGDCTKYGGGVLFCINVSERLRRPPGKRRESGNVDVKLPMNFTNDFIENCFFQNYDIPFSIS